MGKYFPYGVREPYAVQDVADKVLNDFLAVATKFNIRACLAYGLCLGFVRDGGYIEGDNDLDVVVVTETGGVQPSLVDAFEDDGFVFKTGYAPPSNNIHLVKDGILLDAFGRTADGFYKRFGEVVYKGRAYPTPCPVGDYLDAVYTDWHAKSNEAGKCGV